MRKHIVIVDDEELFREICREMLEDRGYRVSVAPEASSALGIVEAEPVDLLVADITLPGMDGLEMVEKARALQPELPAIVITGFLTQENMLRSLNLGVSGFLTKPFFYDELFVAVEKALHQTQAARQKLLMQHYLPMIHLGEEILTTHHEDLFSKTLSTVLRIGLKQTGATRALLAIPAGENGKLELAASQGFDAEDQPAIPVYLEQLQDAVSPELEEVISEELIPGMVSQVVRIPGASDHSGVLVLANPRDTAGFFEEERKLGHLLAVQAAIAIHQYNFHNQTVSTSRNLSITLHDLAAAMVPPGAGGTGEERMALCETADRVAAAIGLPPGARDRVCKAVLLHDLGKAFLPEELVNKPSTLSRAERQTLQRYPEVGAERLKRAEGLARVADLVAVHRECLDGTGFPNGLSGEAVSEEVQIVGAITAWGAMITPRPYREALSPAEARDILRAGAGTRFSPKVVDVLLTELEGEKQEMEARG